MFADGWLRLTKSQSVFVTEELTQTYWEVLQRLNADQWAHVVRVALEDANPPRPGMLWPTGVLLGWGRSYIDPNVRLLPEARSSAWAKGHPDFPRREAEDVVAYVDRLARQMGYRDTGVKEMPDGVRLPYREAGEEG
jgi:hypothetical protein